MKLEANIGDVQSVIDFRDEGECVFAEVDGRSYQLEVQEVAPGRYTLLHEGLVFECRIEGTPDSGKTVDVFVGNRQVPIAIIDPKRLRSATTASAHADGAARIIAPMPGKVVRVLVEAGAQVEAGDGVVVVEAMKMQNEMKSPKAGLVSTLNAQVGATVNAGDVLAVIE
jgi:biotin carboxyl carrier protein